MRNQIPEEDFYNIGLQGEKEFLEIRLMEALTLFGNGLSHGSMTFILHAITWTLNSPQLPF